MATTSLSEISNLKRKVLLGFTALLLSACTALSIDLDPAFSANADVYPVTGRQGLLIRQRLNFGPYHTDVVDRDWDSSNELQIANYKSSDRHGGFRYTLQGPRGEQQRIDCQHQNNSESLNFGSAQRGEWSWLLTAENRFGCEIKRDNTSPQWHIAMGQRGGETHRRGALYSNDASYHIHSIHSANNSSINMGVIGYQISRNQQILAAVETIDQGRVWLHNALGVDEAQLLAAAASALLLYQAPED